METNSLGVSNPLLSCLQGTCSGRQVAMISKVKKNFFLILKIFIGLAVPGLSCELLQAQHVNFFN